MSRLAKKLAKNMPPLKPASHRLMDIPESIASKLKRPPAILGAGVSGAAVARLLGRAGCRPVFYDEKGTAGSLDFLGTSAATRHDLVVHSPGFPPAHPWLEAARAAGATCLGEMDFAFLFWKAPLLSVTGTNGKTTLTEFLTFALKRAGRDAVSAGNIGFPLSSVLELSGKGSPFPVCEVSSFQSEVMRYFVPSALLWTNFDEDHLERHGKLENYFRAKYRLVERLVSGGLLVVGESVAAAAKKFNLLLPPQTQVATRAEVFGKIPQESPLANFPQAENYALARRYWLAEGLPERALEESARVFKTSRHRLAKTAEIDGVSFWNDSKGTNFHATLAALAALHGTEDGGAFGAGKHRVHWIGGGRWKGGNVGRFAERLAAGIDSADLIGETAPELYKKFSELGVPVAVHDSLGKAVRTAAARARSGGAVLFSPGFSSFDMFQGYAARGAEFEQIVSALKDCATNKVDA